MPQLEKKNISPLRKKISMGPEGRNDASSDENNVKKFIYEQEECPIGTVLSVGTLLV